MNQLIISETTRQDFLIDYLILPVFMSEASSVLYNTTYNISNLHRTHDLFFAAYYILCLWFKLDQFIHTCRIYPYALVLLDWIWHIRCLCVCVSIMLYSLRCVMHLLNSWCNVTDRFTLQTAFYILYWSLITVQFNYKFCVLCLFKKWLLHIQRMQQNRIPLKSVNYRSQGRSIGRPKKRRREQL
jgi:hypothetical protein